MLIAKIKLDYILNDRSICKVLTEDIISMAEFVVKYNYFEFNENF